MNPRADGTVHERRDQSGERWRPSSPPRASAPALLASALLVTAAACGGGESRVALSDAEQQAVRAVDDAYVEAWVANEPEKVMSTLAEDAAIVPDGMGPIRGDSAIRAYWWPDDGSETRITSYETTVDEAGGSGDVAYLVGRGRLAFDWRASADEEWASYTSRSAWTAILRRESDGAWRMTHRTWHRVDQP